MSVSQTALWVWTYCNFQGWDNGEAYAEKFRNHGITGSHLRQIDRDNMEHVLGIESREHRAQLIVAIDLLFPSRLSTQLCEINIPSSSFSIHDGQTMFQRRVSNLTGRFTPIVPSESLSAFSGSHASTFARNTDESAQTDRSSISSYSGHSSQSEKAEYSHRSNTFPWSLSNSQLKETSLGLGRKWRAISSASLQNGDGSSQKWKGKQCRKLVVTLSTDEEKRKAELDRIGEFGDQVRVQDMKNPDSKTLIFQDRETALKTERMLSQESFKIAMKYSPRPRPKATVKYVTLEELTVRAGKSLSNKIVCTLPKNKMVIVNQLKGRRARLIYPITGWVSMYTPAQCTSGTPGTPLLTRVCADYNKC